LFLKNPEILGLKGWATTTSRFKSLNLESFSIKALLYSINISYVDPKGTTNSKEHNEISKKYGLDRHTTSAYLIALKGIKII